MTKADVEEMLSNFNFFLHSPVHSCWLSNDACDGEVEYNLKY